VNEGVKSLLRESGEAINEAFTEASPEDQLTANDRWFLKRLKKIDC
jgi:hypothetical protein